MIMPTNPYGGKPGGGITLPEYYRPTPYIGNRNNYFPTSEQLGPDEMRISFVGSCPYPPRRSQAGTCIMLELGDGQFVHEHRPVELDPGRCRLRARGAAPAPRGVASAAG